MHHMYNFVCLYMQAEPPQFTSFFTTSVYLQIVEMCLFLSLIRKRIKYFC